VQADRRRAREDRQDVKRHPATPDDTVVWLSSAEVALMLRVSRAYVRRLARSERLPATVHNRRIWFRRSHIEQYVAARVVEHSRHVPRPDVPRTNKG